MDAKNMVIPVAATPALQFILNFAGLLKLLPLTHWEWNESILLPITYIVTTGTAAIACLWVVRTKRVKALLIAVGIMILLGSLYLYTWASTTPPTRGNLLFYDLVGYVSFFLTYISFGFVVAHVVNVFTQK
jgi:hypothetical protein